MSSDNETLGEIAIVELQAIVRREHPDIRDNELGDINFLRIFIRGRPMINTATIISLIRVLENTSN